MQELSITRPSLLHQEIADAVRRAIVSGQFKPGERLLEAELAERLGVSRAPLREALRQLEDEGLVLSAPHRGTTVARLTPNDVHEIYSLRRVLEELAVSIVVRSISPAELRSLRSLVSEMEAAAGRGDAAHLVDLDMRCHETILRLSRHSRLYAAWKRMEGQLRLFFAAADQLFEDHQLSSRHARLIDAIASGDENEAMVAVREHIGHAAELILAQQGEEGTERAS